MGGYRLIASSSGIVLRYKPLTIVDAVLTGYGYVLMAGDLDKMSKIAELVEAETIYYDNIILPGFVDAHMHLDGLGLMLSAIDLSSIKSCRELLDTLSSSESRIGEWIIARGFDHNLFIDKEFPSRSKLDKVSSKIPILIIHRSGHMGVVNTSGLRRLLEVLDDELVLKYVNIEDGIVYEDALYALINFIKDEIDALNKIDIYVKAQNELLSNGVTAAGIAGVDPRSIDELEFMYSKNLLKIRTYLYVFAEPSIYQYLVYKVLKHYRSAGLLRINGVKIILDGALGTHTAYLSYPYNDKDTSGKLLVDPEKLEEIVEHASHYGLQVAIHAIGDGALDHVLRIYSKYKVYVEELRHRIEHASLIRDDQLDLIKTIKPVVVVQPNFIISDKWLIERIGMERIRWSYRFKTLYNTTHLAFSTDAPVEPVNPWQTVYAAITRGVSEGVEHGKYTLDERLELLDALDAYTRGSAYALHDEKLGCLEPGCYADYIVVDKNPFEIGIDEIRKIRILETVIGGDREVYKR